MRFLPAVALTCFLSAPGFAGAFGPPYTTDDPEPVDWHHWEVIFASQYQRTHGDSLRTFPNIDVNYGLAPDTQLSFTFPFLYDMPTGGPNHWGYADTFVSLKYRFLHETKRSPQAAIFPQIVVPTGDSVFTNRQAQFFLPIWFQKSCGDWSSYWGGGFWRNPGAGNHDYWVFGWQAQRNLTKSLALGGEIFYRSASEVGGQKATGFNFGGVYDFDDGHHFLLSIGSDFGGPNLATLYLGYQWTFGRKESKPK